MMNRLTLLLVSILLTPMGATQAADSLDDGVQRLAILDVVTGQYRLLAPHTNLQHQGSPCFSPSQKHVAFDAWAVGDTFNAVRLLISDVENPDQPPVDFGSGAMPSYSKTGEEIAFSRPGHGIWIMDADGRGEVQISTSAWHIVFSPLDEDIVAYGVRDSSGPNIMIQNLLTDETRLMLSDEVAQKYRQIYWNFQWSSDGQRMLFKAQRTSGETVLVVVRTADGSSECIELGKLEVMSRSCFHPRSGHVYFSINVPNQLGRRIFSIDPDASDLSKTSHGYLMTQPDGHSNKAGIWSADGKKLAILTVELPDPNRDRVSERFVE